MQADAIAIHTVKMLNDRFGRRQIARAIGALAAEPLTNKVAVFLSINFNRPLLADLATQFVKKHADQFVCYVRLGTSRG